MTPIRIPYWCERIPETSLLRAPRHTSRSPRAVKLGNPVIRLAIPTVGDFGLVAWRLARSRPARHGRFLSVALGTAQNTALTFRPRQNMAGNACWRARKNAVASTSSRRPPVTPSPPKSCSSARRPVRFAGAGFRRLGRARLRTPPAPATLWKLDHGRVPWRQDRRFGREVPTYRPGAQRRILEREPGP
jgi:hypothetical protein